MQFTAADENVPVLIVGRGGAGLTASMLLARQGLEHLLVRARATTSDLPKVHVLNQRAMEVLDDVGAALYDPRCLWLRHRETASDGAILVRLDRFVAWRCATGAADPWGSLAGALSEILARPIEAPVPVGVNS